MPDVFDARIRKVKALEGIVRLKAEKKGLKPEDLVIVKTTIEKVKGDPVSHLLKRVNRIPKNKIELLKELEEIAKGTCSGQICSCYNHETKVFALALAYLIGDLCPNDRETKFVFRKDRKVI